MQSNHLRTYTIRVWAWMRFYRIAWKKKWKRNSIRMQKRRSESKLQWHSFILQIFFFAGSVSSFVMVCYNVQSRTNENYICRWVLAGMDTAMHSFTCAAIRTWMALAYINDDTVSSMHFPFRSSSSCSFFNLSNCVFFYSFSVCLVVFDDAAVVAVAVNVVHAMTIASFTRNIWRSSHFVSCHDLSFAFEPCVVAPAHQSTAIW